MDFFTQQEKARAASGRLVWMYGVAVVGIAISIHAAVAGIACILQQQRAETEVAEGFLALFLKPELAAWTLGLTALVIVIGTLVKVGSLRGGGSKVAESLGGREVAPDTQDFAERRLLNVVEEMALAASVRVPRVYILDKEAGMNAFAAGYSPEDAAIAVTAGLLRTLNREELQAVVGHEFSHLLNGDMRLNIRLIGVLGGILGLAVVGRVVMEVAGRTMRFSSGRRSSKKNDGAAVALAFLLLGLALWLIGSIGVLFGRMIQSAVSRHREFLADASSVQFTRNPASLAGALKLIGATSEHGTLRNSHSAEVAHMLFASGRTSLFATHPSLLQRIQRLDPAFDGDYESVRALLARRTEEGVAVSRGDGDGDDLHDGVFAGAAAMQSLPRPLHDGELAATAPLRDRAQGAAGMLAWLGEEERDALRDAASAECCLYASILATDSSVRARQLAAVRARAPESPSVDEQGVDASAFADATEGWHARHAAWTGRQRRMACELAAETLRAASPALRAAIVERLDVLSRADGQLDSFEFALGRMVRRRLQPDPANVSARSKLVPPTALASEASLVLSQLADYGSQSPEAAREAWNAGAARLSLFGPLAQVAVGELDLTTFEAALERLSHLPPLAKREFMSACEALVRNDGEMIETEENFLVAIADAIDAVGWNLAA